MRFSSEITPEMVEATKEAFFSWVEQAAQGGHISADEAQLLRDGFLTGKSLASDPGTHALLVKVLLHTVVEDNRKVSLERGYMTQGQVDEIEGETLAFLGAEKALAEAEKKLDEAEYDPFKASSALLNDVDKSGSG